MKKKQLQFLILANAEYSVLTVIRKLIVVHVRSHYVISIVKRPDSNGLKKQVAW